MPPRWLLAGVVVGASAFTLLVSVTSVVSFAYRSPSLHVAGETAAALISLLAAQLVYGRFRRSLERGDLLVTAALIVFAGSNLAFSAIPVVAGLGSESFATWAPLASTTLAAVLLAAGVFAPPRTIHRPGPAARRAGALCLLALAGMGIGTAIAGDWLPRAIEPGLSPEASSRPRIVGEPSVLALQLVVMALFAATAVGFARRAQATGDQLALWFAIGVTLAAFARLNYFLFPSRYSEFFYTGDVLRLGFFVALLIGGAREIRIAQRELERAAVHDERRRLAREIHDGMAQDLAFIVQQAEALDARNGGSRAVAEIATAARRALDESRGVIAALVRPAGEPLADALTHAARAASGRWGGTVETAMVDGLEVSTATREALLRIVAEAVTNAARHGQAQHIVVELAERPLLQVRIVDDGVGFDPLTLGSSSDRHGITGMRERAEQIGAVLDVESRPGHGARIVVTVS